jgi:hypothetical protein
MCLCLASTDLFWKSRDAGCTEKFMGIGIILSRDPYAFGSIVINHGYTPVVLLLRV